jgi:hypothetical protein
MQDKENMRSYLASANIESKESDTFTELSQTVVANSGTQLCVYAQPDEPASKVGVWFKTDEPKTITGIKALENFYVKDSWAKISGLPQKDTINTYGAFGFGDYVYYMEDADHWVRYPLEDNFAVKETLCSLTEAFGEGKATASNLFARGWAYWDGYVYGCASLADYGAPGPYTAYNCDVVRYHIESNTWEYVTTLLHPEKENVGMPIREMAAVNGKIYLFGTHYYDSSISSSNGRSPYQNKYWIIDHETKEITGPYNMSPSRWEFGVNAVVDNRYIYFFGCKYYTNISQYSPNTTQGKFSQYAYCLDTYDHSWRSIAAMPDTYGADGVCPVVIGTDIFLMGCPYKANSSYSGKMCYKYDTLTNTYTELPRAGLSSSEYDYRTVYNEKKKVITIFGNKSTTKIHYQESIGQTFPEGTVVLNQCLPTSSAHTCNFYYNDKIDTTEFKTTYFTNIYLWDEANNDRYRVDTYLGDGEKWTKIN